MSDLSSAADNQVMSRLERTASRIIMRSIAGAIGVGRRNRPSGSPIASYRLRGWKWNRGARPWGASVHGGKATLDEIREKIMSLLVVTDASEPAVVPGHADTCV